jgi:hypothetical protein
MCSGGSAIRSVAGPTLPDRTFLSNHCLVLEATKGGQKARATAIGISLNESAKERPGVGPARLACPIAETEPSDVVR